MSTIRETIYQFESILSSVDVITDRETRTYDASSTSYTLYNTTSTSILKVTGTASGSTTTFTEDTDYSHVTGSITWGLGGTDPDDASTFYVDYVWTRTLNVGEGYPCDPSDLPYVAIDVESSVERLMNVGLKSSRGYDTVYMDLLVYVTLYEGKETDTSASTYYTKKEMLNMTTEAVKTKLMQNKRLGDYIVDIKLLGMTGRLYDPFLNAYTRQMRYDVETVKEARF